MGNKQRKFTPEEKISLLREAQREGVAETCRKYNLSPSLLSYWKKKYEARGMEGLRGGHRKEDPELKTLKQENERLKRIIAKQALEIEFKSELLQHTAVDPLKKKR